MRPKLDELRFMFGSPRFVWFNTLVNVPSALILNRSVIVNDLLKPADRLKSPGPSTDPTWLLPKRPMGNGCAPSGASVSGSKPAPVVQGAPRVQVESPGHAKAAALGPIEPVLAVRTDADSRQLIGMLVTVAAVKAASAVAESAVQSRAGSGGIALPAGEIGRLVRSGLHRQDRGDRHPPAISSALASMDATEHLAAAEGQVVERGRIPA